MPHSRVSAVWGTLLVAGVGVGVAAPAALLEALPAGDVGAAAGLLAVLEHPAVSKTAARIRVRGVEVTDRT